MTEGKEKGKERQCETHTIDKKPSRDNPPNLFFCAASTYGSLSQGLEKKYVKHPNAFLANHSSS
jgi:hypothetical protein